MRARMASRSGGASVRKASAVWPLAPLRGLEDWRRKRTAAKVRVWRAGQLSSTSRSALSTLYWGAHARVRGKVNLLGQAHQEHLWPL